MISILVTGSGGFIGRVVVASLTSLGYAVHRWTGLLEDLRGHTESTRAVVHLASMPRHGGFASEPTVAHAVEVAGIEAVLDYCRLSGSRCIFASTAGVYRAATQDPQGEDAPTGPESAYAAGKLAAEARCEAASDESGVRCAILRIFNVYGPGQRSPFLLPYLLDTLAAGELLELKMPEAVRDFVFVDDVARAFADAVRSPLEGCRVFNVGTGRGTRVADLVAMAARVIGKPPRWSTVQAVSGEIPFSVADIRRARTELGWEPTTSLDAGIAATWAGRMSHSTAE